MTAGCNGNVKVGETGLWMTNEPSAGPSSQCCRKRYHVESYWGKHACNVTGCPQWDAFCIDT